MIANVKKLNLFVTAIILVVTNSLIGQNYTITPNDTVISTVPFNDLYHLNIQQNNLTAGHLVFSWEKIEVSFTDGWEANLCDNGNCYAGFPDTGTMDTVFSGDYGLMSIGINPLEILGTATVQYIIWEENTPDQIDTLTWFVSTESPTNIENATALSNIFMYSNSADNQINIQTSLINGFDFVIRNMVGGGIISGKSTSSNLDISVNDLKSGIYLVSIVKNMQILKTTKLIIIN